MEEDNQGVEEVPLKTSPLPTTKPAPDKAALAQTALGASSYMEIRRLCCVLGDGGRLVVIKGKVSSFFLKQMAQQILISKGFTITNQIEVKEAS
jgi:hypothetical protein